jgi:hypothetical protein
VIEDLGGPPAVLPIPDSHPQDEENNEFNYVFVSSRRSRPLADCPRSARRSLAGVRRRSR